ncbi:MAG: penicillin-binding transpeptidase domain-containing protein [Planctomycetota bacterium]
MARSRILFLAFLFACLAFSLVVQLCSLQLRQHEFWLAEGVRMRTRAQLVAAPRGALLDRRGRPFALNDVCYRLRFIYAEFRLESGLGQLQMAHFLLDGKRSTLAELIRASGEAVRLLAAITAGEILEVQPGRRQRDLVSYLERLSGARAKSLAKRLGEVAPAARLDEIVPSFSDKARASVGRAVATLEGLARLLGEGDLVASLDVAIRFLDERVAERCKSGTYTEERELHHDYDRREGTWERSPVNYELVRELGCFPTRYPGFEIVEEARRRYPAATCDLAPGLIGFVGAVRGEDLEETENHRDELRRLREGPLPSIDALDRLLKLEVLVEEIDYVPGDERGLLGLEALLEPLLRGKRGSLKVEKDWVNEVRRVVEERPALPGRDVTLTLDADVQAAVEDVLARAPDILAAEFSGIGVALILLPAGEVLALGSWPPVARDDYLRAYGEESRLEREAREQGRFWLGSGVYHRAYTPRLPPPPGSVFKPLVALAGLQVGELGPDFTPYCNHGIEPKTDAGISCLGVHGSVTLDDAIVKSCNAYFAEAARELGYAPIRAAAEAFGFGHATGFAWTRLYPEHSDTISLTERGTPLFVEPSCAITGPSPSLKLMRLFGCGQSWIDDVTPLQVARAMGGLALGYLPEVHIVRGVRGLELRPPRPGVLPFDPAHLERIRQALERVASPEGTARPLGDRDLRRWHVACKTGSATHGGFKRNDKYLHHAWIAGYLPADAPRLAFAAVVEMTLVGGGEAGVKLMHELLSDPRLSPYLEVTPP